MARATLDPVVTAAAGQAVIVRPTRKAIIPTVAIDRIVASPTVQRIIARIGRADGRHLEVANTDRVAGIIGVVVVILDLDPRNGARDIDLQETRLGIGRAAPRIRADGTAGFVVHVQRIAIARRQIDRDKIAVGVIGAHDDFIHEAIGLIDVENTESDIAHLVRHAAVQRREVDAHLRGIRVRPRRTAKDTDRRTVA